MIPEQDICIIILNNHESANPEYLTRKIIDILNGKPVELTPEVTLTTKQLEELIGAWSMKEPRQMMIYTSIVDGRLAIAVAGQTKTTVVARNEDTFIQAEANAILQFRKNEKGVYSMLEITQGAYKMKAERVKSFWGLVGDATPKGWSDSVPDIRFKEDAERKSVWRLNNVTLKKGEIKFRLDNDWNINYGDNEADNILDLHGANIKIERGTYDIELDLTDETMPRYKISKN